MNNVFPLRPGEQKEGSDSGDGGGPEDPMLEQRVGRPEEKVDRIEAILVRLEPKISEVLQNTAKQSVDLNKLQLDFARFEAGAATKDDLHQVQADIVEIKGRLTGVDGRLTGIDGRLSGISDRFASLPTVWTDARHRLHHLGARLGDFDLRHELFEKMK